MKLLQVTPYLHPRAGGPPVVVSRHSASLAARGWEVTVVTTDLHGAGASGSARGHGEIAAMAPPPVALELLAADRPALMGLSSRAAAVLERTVAASDLVQVHTLWHPLLGQVRRLCRRLDKPYLVMPHGMLDPYSLGVRRWRKALYLALVEGRNLRAAARMVYTTDQERALAEAEVARLPPAAVVPLGGDAPHTRDPTPLVEGFLGRFPVARDRRRLLFLSRIHPKKGLDRLLALLPELRRKRPDLLLVVVGSGEPDHLRAVERRIESLGLADAVLLCGRLTGDLKWGAYAAAELFALPSRQENFGLVVAEAMQMGLPVVVSDRVNSCSYVAAAGAGVVCDASRPDLLLAALAALLDDPERARAMGASGRAFATRRLTWEASADHLESCYCQALGNR